MARRGGGSLESFMRRQDGGDGLGIQPPPSPAVAARPSPTTPTAKTAAWQRQRQSSPAAGGKDWAA
ncbi:hypothetical protein THAOC_36550, partial [Thalassiosira oceanica]